MNSVLQIIIFGAEIPLYDIVGNINRQPHSSHFFNINHDTYRTGVLGNLKNFNFALLLLPLHPGMQQYSFLHYRPSKIHYSLNCVFKIFPINRTTASRKLHDRMILERQLLMNTIFI